MPYRQLNKDPAVVVYLGDKTIRLDDLAKGEPPLEGDRSLYEIARTSIEQADAKYAAMWKLYVFLSDGLFYTGILPKLLLATEAAQAEDLLERHHEKLQQAQGFFIAAFDAKSLRLLQLLV